MSFFEIVDLPPGSHHRFGRVASKEKLIVCAGSCRIAVSDEVVDVAAGGNLDLLDAAGVFDVLEVRETCTLVRMCGTWGEELGGSGIFAVNEDPNRVDRGNPVPYPKSTGFDAHYHDCDEYWIVFAGRGRVVTEGKSFEVGPGDCVATGMGHHHDFPQAYEPVRAVFFETTMEGAKRRGHLWEHTHGPADPQMDRL